MHRNRQNQSSPDLPGLDQLYLPHLFYASTPGRLRANQGPANMLRTFPFPDPGSGRVPAALQCRELYAAPLRTGPTSHTATVQAVSKLVKEKRLRFIKRAGSLVAHLIEYSKPNGDVPWMGDPQQRPRAPSPLNTWRMFRSGQILKASQQVIAINRLSSWFEGHHQRLPPEMTSEPSVQDEVYIQLLNPLSMLLSTRYINNNSNERTFYPQWGRTCAARANNSTAPPDYILIGTPQAGSQCVVFEVKTWWSYDFLDLFSEDTAEPNENPFSKNAGAFNWSARTETCKLLKQLWGQLHFNGCRWGACTNGKLIFVFHKPNDNTLCISPPIGWTDARVHQVLLGLCFAALDERMYNINKEEMSSFFVHSRSLDTDWFTM
ncbi:hypothetical protein BU17DRAFT_60143 [Hysterangium stoloniferum]|nr:hypothetical protein BU17DRAFT_60143 [Hysterangium stoloniferum]